MLGAPIFPELFRESLIRASVRVQQSSSAAIIFRVAPRVAGRSRGTSRGNEPLRPEPRLAQTSEKPIASLGVHILRDAVRPFVLALALRTTAGLAVRLASYSATKIRFAPDLGGHFASEPKLSGNER